jgi:hypothetical protein
MNRHPAANAGENSRGATNIERMDTDMEIPGGQASAAQYLMIMGRIRRL